MKKASLRTQTLISAFSKLRILFAISLTIFSIASFGQKAEKLTVYYKFNKYNLEAKEKNKIDSIIKNKTIQHIFLQGHCDSIGNNEYNDALSLKRAEDVKEYLTSKNIATKQIEYNAMGKRVLLNKSTNENERALNRRVEIKFTFQSILQNQKEVTINGIVLNEQQQPIPAEISLNDKNGKEIQSVSNDKNGKYELKTTINKNEEYLLIYYNDSSFISSKKIIYTDQTAPYPDLKTILPQLRGGKKYILENMNFEGDTSQLLAKSHPSLVALEKLMKKNKTLVIRIEGHVNYLSSYPNPKTSFPQKRRFVPKGMNSEQFNQWLSDERAKTVSNYLVSKGIDASRIMSIGFSNSKMLYPNATSEFEMEQNRRVEINVISFK